MIYTCFEIYLKKTPPNLKQFYLSLVFYTKYANLIMHANLNNVIN